MKCPVCKDYDFEHSLDLEKHALAMHGVSMEKLSRESAPEGRRAASDGRPATGLRASRQGEK
jgi:hypothetical protein